MVKDCPELLETTSNTLVRSTPAFFARTIASQAPRVLNPSMIWLISFMAFPDPTGPTWNMVLPMTSNIGRQRSRTASSPPTMNVRVPSWAPLAPPLTGASRTSMPLGLQASATRSTTWGVPVVASMRTLPEVAPSSHPPSLRIAASTSASAGTQRTVTDTAEASSAPDLWGTAPSASNARALSVLRS